MIIDAVSDLHGSYPELEGGDLLIVAGDLTAADKHHQYLEFLSWLHKQNYKHYIFIAGNHDKLIQKGEVLTSGLYNTSYLCDSGTEFEFDKKERITQFSPALDSVYPNKKKLKIWGSPWTPRFEGVNPLCDAFMLSEAELEAKFALIPDDTDILITHGPPYGILDKSRRAHRVGSKSLMMHVQTRLNPKLHVFGHIHEGYGKELSGFANTDTDDERTMFVNCAHMDGDYEPVNKPIRVIL